MIPTTSGDTRIWGRCPRVIRIGYFSVLDVEEFWWAVESALSTKSRHAAAILAMCDDSLDGGVVYRVEIACVTCK